MNKLNQTTEADFLKPLTASSRHARVPGYCGICAVGWASFGIFYLLRGYTTTCLLCALVTVLLTAIYVRIARTPQRFRRYANIHLSISCIGLITECFLSGLSASSTVPFLGCMGIIAAHQSGIRAAVVWTIITSAVVVAMHFCFDPADWFQLRTENLLDNAVSFAGFFALVTWMATKAVWSATTYQEKLITSSSELAHLANHDQLTQLANRHRFHSVLELAKETHLSSEQSLGLLILDLDSFKNINDKLGHTAGDELLVQVANRIYATIGESDTAARIGGDEFTVIVNDATPDRIATISSAIATSLSQPLQIGGEEVVVSASMGGALLPDHTRCVDELLIFADLAVYAAKKSGKGFECYSPAMTENYKRKRFLAAQIDRAIENGEFSLVYQPQVSVSANQILGVEALLRWNRTEIINGIEHSEFISPDEFVPILESTGKIHEVGRWVIEQGCLQANEWLNMGIECSVSVNVSPIQFRATGFVQNIVDILRETGTPPEYLDLEITEGVMVDRLGETSHKLQLLKQSGVSISVDDFGTGYSSLAYLKHLPISRLKIDRVFIKDIPDSDDGTIASSIVALARTLNLEVLAEGVETVEQRKFLFDIDCQTYQGYHFSRPIPAAECAELLLSNSQAGSHERCESKPIEMITG